MEIGMTLLGQALSFAILILFTAKFIWPPLMAAIEARQQKIAEGLAAADRSQRDLAQAEDRVGELLREARDRGNEIIANAETRAGQMVEKAKDDAIAEGQRQKELAQADIDAQSHRLREALRSEVSNLALAGAEKIVAREIDAATHRALLDELANSLQAAR